MITAADAALSTDVAAAAVRKVARGPGTAIGLLGRCRTGPSCSPAASRRAPTRSVLRLIDTCSDSSQHDRSPALPPLRSNRPPAQANRRKVAVPRLHRESRAQPCGRCRAVREAATRDQHGRPLCGHCPITDPANHKPASNASGVDRYRFEHPTDRLCGKCVPRPVLTCAVCGRTDPVISRGDRQAVVLGVQAEVDPQRALRQVAPLRGGTVHEPLCSLFTRPDDQVWRSCPGCGQPGRIHRGRCARCTMTARLHDCADTPNAEKSLPGTTATKRPGKRHHKDIGEAVGLE